MANSDKRQAALDAVQDILKARLAGQMGGMMGGAPGGEVDMDIDPELNMPQAKGMQQPPMNVEIKDPDGVLAQQKQNHQQQKQGGSQQQKSQQSSDKSSSQDQGQSNGESSDNGNKKQDKPDGKQSGSSSDDKDSQKSDEKKDGKGSDDKKGLTKDDIEKAAKNEPGEKSDEYVKDWNDTIDKFDNNETSDEELEKQASNKNNSKGTKDAISAIQTSRERKLEVDPDYDKRLKLPKNSEIKQFDDSDDGETEEERKERIGKIQKSFDDADAVDQDIKDIEADVAIKQADAMQAKKQELDRIAKKGQLLDFADFSGDLFNAIKTQIDDAREPEDSFFRPNATYANSDVIMPSQVYGEQPMIPTINVYFDQSASWGRSDIQKGIDALASIKDFEYQNRVRVNLYYFANHLHDTENGKGWYENGTQGFPEVVANVRDTGATNVLIMTDDDIEHQTDWRSLPTVEVEGCVWYLWKYGSRSHNAPKHLFGAQGTFQYNLK